MTKFDLDMYFLMTYPYVKFELNVCNRYKDNERKLMMTERQKNGMREQGKTICPSHNYCLQFSDQESCILRETLLA
jgi:hypothetical protein